MKYNNARSISYKLRQKKGLYDSYPFDPFDLSEIKSADFTEEAEAIEKYYGKRYRWA